MWRLRGFRGQPFHGACGQIEIWNEHVDDLANTHRVIAYDGRGHGRSPNPTQNFRVHMNDAAELLTELAMSPATVVGYSSGGAIALMLALEHPELDAAGRRCRIPSDVSGRRRFPVATGGTETMGVPSYLMKLFREAPSKRRLMRSLSLGMRGGDRTVTSADGTSLSVRKSGDGDPVVMVHGALAGIGAFSLIELTIAERYGVWVYDRRGRGDSGDGPEYALEREIEDLQAVLDVAGTPAHVVGHSYGALIALAAAGAGTPMRSLTLYEPPLRQDQIDHAVIEDVVTMVDGGDLDQAITTMATELAGISRDELAIPRRIKPLWNQFRDGVGVIERELTTVGGVDWDRFDLPVGDRPVLVIRGGRDCAPVYPRPEDLPRFVTDPEIVDIPGQGHLALSFEPNRFADAIVDFVDRH